MKTHAPRPFPVDLWPEFARSVTLVDTDPGDDTPHLTLQCGHGIYLCGVSLVEAQLRSQEKRFCSQCLNEWQAAQQVRVA